MFHLANVVLLVALSSPPQSGSVDSGAASRPPQQVSAPVSLARADSQLIALRAEIDEIRRSETRMISLAQWAIGAVLSVALLLGGFNWWSQKHGSRAELDVLRGEAKRLAEDARAGAVAEITAHLNRIGQQLRQDVSQAVSADLLRYQAEAISVATLRESRIRTYVKDFDGAVLAARECYSAAQSGNTNYIAHALDAISEAFEGAANNRGRIAQHEVVATHQLLLSYSGLHTDPRAARVKALVDQLL